MPRRKFGAPDDVLGWPKFVRKSAIGVRDCPPLGPTKLRPVIGWQRCGSQTDRQRGQKQPMSPHRTRNRQHDGSQLVSKSLSGAPGWGTQFRTHSRMLMVSVVSSRVEELWFVTLIPRPISHPSTLPPGQILQGRDRSGRVHRDETLGVLQQAKIACRDQFGNFFLILVEDTTGRPMN